MNETEIQAAANKYLEEVKALFYSGKATEISYRGNLEQFLESLLPEIDAINEPKRVSVGAPDFVLVKRSANPQQLELVRSVPLGFIEAKDLQPGILDKKENQSQIERYMDLGNVVHTDGLIWRFYFERKLIKEVSHGYINDQKHLVTSTESLEDLEFYLRQTVETAGRTIRSAKALALHMADRAKPIRRTILSALTQDLEAEERTDIVDQYHAFKETLIHDLTEKDFADIYAETIAYGLFAARYNDDTIETFSLVEAAQKVPQTNPFLRQFFLQIAAYEKDVRLDWVLNNFADLFSYADVHKIMSTYGKTTGMNHDPVTHFYETFLGEYDSKRRKARGVYYTPLPVVQYIVRAVDKVLKEEFGLSDGLADDSTVSHTFRVDPYSKSLRKGAKQYTEKTVEIPRVQILDPATGTSTFLNETVKLIAERKVERLGSAWNDYVEKNLLPRIHGFEILMAAYSMAHMRLGLTLAETGYTPSANAPRLGVYLTNSLEEPAQDEPPLLAMMGMGRALTEEAIAADKVKRDLPIMVVMGNPPYSVSSANKSKYIDKLMADYKKDLNERNIQPLSDDYIKFIRYAENMIEKNGQGVVAMITNNSFIDGLIHRQMRKHLLETFDKIWVLDLHGNAKKKEVAPDGGKDENVFDIMQGVSIVIMTKTGRNPQGKLAELQVAELYGKRAEKYAALGNEIKHEEIFPQEPRHFFVKKDEKSQIEYESYISIRELMPVSSSGIQTKRDELFIDSDEQKLIERSQKLLSSELNDDFMKKYNVADSSGYNMLARVNSSYYDSEKVSKYAYRPFDDRYIYYDENLIGRAFFRVMRHMQVPNIALTVSRQFHDNFKYILVADMLTDINYIANAGKFGGGYTFPLWLDLEEQKVRANYEHAKLKELLQNLEPYCYVDSEDDLHAPVDDFVITAVEVLDYIYGVLHSPSYREKYKEFLKIDFPRVPKPENIGEFSRFAEFGKRLRELHLMHGVTPEDYRFKGEGDGEVQKVSFVVDETSEFTSADANGVILQQGKLGRVYINDSQYFISIPDIAWNFYIGGYQPAQKWLKDRKGRALGYKDIEHYQRIITVLMETDRIMKEIG